MGNGFIALCYMEAKKAGVDTSKMSTDEVIEWYNKSKSKERTRGELKDLILKTKDTETKSLTKDTRSVKLTKQERGVLNSAVMQKQSKHGEGNFPKTDFAFTSDKFVLYENGNTFGEFKVRVVLDIEKNRDKIKMIEERFKNDGNRE